MKCLNTLFKAFLAMGIVFAFSITLGEIGPANADILTVVRSVGSPVLANPTGPFVPATPFYFPKKFQVPREASDVFDRGEDVEAIKAWLLREIVKGEGLDLIWTGNFREELGAPAIRGEDVITILQKK
ncbi:MAG: hypothetical protein ABSB32_12260 [Thermodesulfobacteriota bacterium]